MINDILEKVKNFFTGKTAEERKKEAEALLKIKAKVNDAMLKEREIQAVKFAKEKVKVEYENRTKMLRQKPNFSSFSIGNSFIPTEDKKTLGHIDIIGLEGKNKGKEKHLDIISGKWI